MPIMSTHVAELARRQAQILLRTAQITSDEEARIKLVIAANRLYEKAKEIEDR